jgi:peptide-methionine (R)-S-oxide reductase
MNRRQSFKWLLGLSALPFPLLNTAIAKEGGFPVNKTNKEWAALLPLAAYRVLFEEDTERSGTSPLNAEKRDGTFVCAACNQPLFDSSKKYESGTGWPSFWEPLPGAIATKTDFKLIYPRTEYHCTRCVLVDIRGTCLPMVRNRPASAIAITGVALQFVLRSDRLPALRV